MIDDRSVSKIYLISFFSYPIVRIPIATGSINTKLNKQPSNKIQSHNEALWSSVKGTGIVGVCLVYTQWAGHGGRRAVQLFCL